MVHVQFKAFAGMLFFLSMHPETVRDVFKKSKYSKPREKKKSLEQDAVPALQLNNEAGCRDEQEQENNVTLRF